MQPLHNPSAPPDWLSDAACGSLPLDQLDLFFVTVGRTIGERARALCEGCTVRSQCLAHAQDHEIANGYFGGASPSARRAQQASSHDVD
jgi:WhiB family transcriptional regulator, redox-sensing transcriptional regulator